MWFLQQYWDMILHRFSMTKMHSPVLLYWFVLISSNFTFCLIWQRRDSCQGDTCHMIATFNRNYYITRLYVFHKNSSAFFGSTLTCRKNLCIFSYFFMLMFLFKLNVFALKIKGSTHLRHLIIGSAILRHWNVIQTQ